MTTIKNLARGKPIARRVSNGVASLEKEGGTATPLDLDDEATVGVGGGLATAIADGPGALDLDDEATVGVG